jgi:hypothetical protein
VFDYDITDPETLGDKVRAHFKIGGKAYSSIVTERQKKNPYGGIEFGLFLLWPRPRLMLASGLPKTKVGSF